MRLEHLKLVGKISEFGGPDDNGMAWEEGLAFAEHAEADLMPDLFVERSKDLTQGTSKRLRCNDAYYIALNVPLHWPRSILKQSRWKITSLASGLYVVAHLIDRGPSAAGRLVDASKAILKAIVVKTDDDVEVEEVTAFGIPFGLYEKAA
jgi:hypothetical protein